MDYKEVLKLVGYPEDVLIIDFESYYDADYTLSKMSTIEYICDPRFELTGMGYHVLNESQIGFPFEPGQDSKIQFVPKPGLEERIRKLQANFGDNLEQVTVVAKNCKFDMTILAVKFGIIPPYIIDIDDLLRNYDARMSHHMKDVTEMFGLQDKGKTVQFKGLHYGDMDEVQKEELAVYCTGDITIETSLFKKLLPMVSNPQVEIPIARHTLDLYLRPAFEFDFKKAKRLRADMALMLAEIVQKTRCSKSKISGNISFVETLQSVLPEGETVPVKKGKPGKNMVKLLGAGNIPALAKDDVKFQALLVHPDENVKNLCVARQAVKSWPLHIKRINNIMNQAAASGGLVRVPLHYFGAHTGRFSGGEKINLQNLGGRGRAGGGIHALIGQMRSLLTAPEGQMLAIADSAQIEARVLAWLAGQSDLVTGFANSEDIYSVFATDLFGHLVCKPMKDEPEIIKRVLKIKRGFGKDAILGCGYGMGPTKFYDRCYSNESLRPLFDSGKYNFAFIKRLVKTYRSKYSKIPKFWKEVERCFKWVIKYPGTTHTLLGSLHFFSENGTVYIQLPSGRTLRYRHCRIDRENTIQWHHGHLWGGSITENIVQAVARDLLVYWILKCEHYGLNVIFSNHDEIICMIETDKAERALSDMCDIMSVGPDWAEGLPLGVEGELSEVYKK